MFTISGQRTEEHKLAVSLNIKTGVSFVFNFCVQLIGLNPAAYNQCRTIHY